jgi:methionyl-tRNA formyltransferase
MMETLDLIDRGEAPRLPQDDARATPAPRLQKEDGSIDWSAAARRIVDRVRGTHPWPGAFTYCGPERLLVHRARHLPAGGTPWSAAPLPGTVAGFTPAGEPVVSAGDGGGVVLVEAQRSGRRAVDGAALARGLRWRGGERLGSAPDG